MNLEIGIFVLILKLIDPCCTYCYSYHQKYLLRQQRDILKALKLSDAELITSHIACRLNGFCGGYGTLEQLEAELPGFKLGPETEERLRKIVSRGQFH